MSDLVKRMRERKASWIGAGIEPDKLCQEAADRIEALESERDALRAALEYYAGDVGNGDIARTALNTNLKTPIAEGKDEISEALDRTWSGMYLRDWFAGQALAAMGKVICEDGSPDDLVIRPDTLSGWAYKYADAMLAARAKGGE